MTLPSSGSISLGQVLDELRVANPNRGYPISLGDADVRALAGVPSGDITLGHLYGKSAISPLTVVGHNDYGFGQSGQTSGGFVGAYPYVTVNGGSGPRTFAWSILSASGTVTISGTNTSQVSIGKNFPKLSAGYIIVYLRCVVSDSTGSVTVDNITAELEWESNM